MLTSNYTTRQYKAVTPIETISKIRNIFNNINYFVFEDSWYSADDQIFSNRIKSDFKDGNFGTNGKGRSKEFSLASAYAEHIERIQNQMLSGTYSYIRHILNKIKEQSNCFYYPDENFITKEEFSKLPKEFFDDFKVTEDYRSSFITKYFARLENNNYKGVLGVPYYDVKNNSIINLPFNIIQQICGSNGMAAGNNPEEAIFQGLCELIERYCAGQVYFKQMTPPSIPESFLKQFPTEYALIKKIEYSTNFKIIIKDFSANTGLPALGIIILDLNEKKYKLNVGSETCFPIALSRCITEIYQGLNNSTIKGLMLPIPEKEHEYFTNSDQNSQNLRLIQYIEFIKSGTGVFPKSLFNDTPDYKFDSKIFKSCSNYKEEVKVLINKILGSGNKIYIRDNSFLGFPTFQIYIPGFSPLGRKLTDNIANGIQIDPMINKDIFEDIILPFDELTSQKLKLVEDLVENNKKIYGNLESIDNSTILIKALLKLEFKENFYWNSLPLSYLNAIINLKENNFLEAKKYMSMFINETNSQNDKYYECIGKYIDLKSENLSNKQIKSNLKQLSFDEPLINEVLNDLSEINIMNGVDFPQCPNCEKCKLFENCLTQYQLNKTIIINKEMYKNIRDQRLISSIIS